MNRLKSYAIIGSGIAGLSCGLALAGAGHTVTLFDKGRRPGGRVATRRATVAGVSVAFNHGAQYATARGEGFAAMMASLHEAGQASPWPAAGRGETAWVGTPGMSTLAQALADRLTSLGATIHCERHVGWLDGAGGLRHVPAAEARPGQVGDTGEPASGFDGILLALPAPQAAALFATASHPFAARMAAIRLAPCWAVMAVFDTPIAGPDTRRPEGGTLAWIARETARPGRAGGPDAWMLHAGAAWSRAHLEDPADAVTAALISAFRTEFATEAAPIHVAAHRWRYAQVETSLGAPCLWDGAAGLGYCGDGCLGPRIESAWDSGAALAAAVIAGTA